MFVFFRLFSTSSTTAACCNQIFIFNYCCCSPTVLRHDKKLFTFSTFWSTYNRVAFLGLVSLFFLRVSKNFMNN